SPNLRPKRSRCTSVAAASVNTLWSEPSEPYETKQPDYFPEARLILKQTWKPAAGVMKRTLFNGSAMTLAIYFSVWCQPEPVNGATVAIVRDNTNAVVSWAYPSRGFGLEFSTNLANWQAASISSLSNSGRWTATTPAGLPNNFFRLKNHLQHFG